MIRKKKNRKPTTMMEKDDNDKKVGPTTMMEMDDYGININIIISYYSGIL